MKNLSFQLCIESFDHFILLTWKVCGHLFWRTTASIEGANDSHGIFLKRFKVDHLQKNLTWFHISFTLQAILLPLLYWPLLDNSCNVILIIYVSSVCVCMCVCVLLYTVELLPLKSRVWCNCRVQLIEGLLYAGAKQVVHGPVERTGLQTNDGHVPTSNYNKFLSAYRRKSRKKWARALVRGPVGARQHGDSCGSLQNPQGEDRWDGQGLTIKGRVPVWTWHPIPTACWRTWSRGVIRTAFPVLRVNVASGRVRHNTVYLHSGKQVPATHQADLKGRSPVRGGPRAEREAEQEGRCWLVTGRRVSKGASSMCLPGLCGGWNCKPEKEGWAKGQVWGSDESVARVRETLLSMLSAAGRV